MGDRKLYTTVRMSLAVKWGIAGDSEKSGTIEICLRR